MEETQGYTEGHGEVMGTQPAPFSLRYAEMCDRVAQMSPEEMECRDRAMAAQVYPLLLEDVMFGIGGEIIRGSEHSQDRKS